MSFSTSKRRRVSTASLASREDETVLADLESTDSKRRKIIKLDPIEQCQQLYDILRNHKKDDGSVLCEPFIRIPKRRQEPAYYEVVSNPMGMLQIQQKIKMDEYDDIDQMSADVDLMVTNAKAFYKRSSQEHKDASELWEFFIESKCRLFDLDTPSEEGDRKGKIILKMGKLARRAAAMESRKPTLGGDGDGGETSESSSNTEKERPDENDGCGNVQMEDLFSAVMVATDSDGRLIHTAFQLLPSKKRYPAYYDVIDVPVDLKMIATKIQAGEYGNLQDMEKDVLLMCKNACNFNEPGSQIYKDAKALKKVVSSKRSEIEHGKHTPGSSAGKTSERIRNRRLRSGLSHSAITAALQYEYDDTDDEEDRARTFKMAADYEEDTSTAIVEDEEEEDGSKYGDSESPMWILYENVCNVTGNSGKLLSEPFKRLPSRRFYPDYYKEIKNPISLAQIKMKIKRGEYAHIGEVQSDLNLMFENAKIYNRPDSSLYKWAVKLQKVATSTVHELQNDDDALIEESTHDVKPFSKFGSSEYLSDGNNMDFQTSPFLRDSSSTSRDSSVTKTPTSGKKSSAKSRGGGSKDASFTSTTPIGIGKIGKDKEEWNTKGLPPKELLKKRQSILIRTLMESKELDGRTNVSLFMEKPSKKMYPDYYRVISEPIDVLTIEANIKIEKYNSISELMKDFQTMFNNCRLYNEEGSLIYEDANKLEKVLNDKLKEMGPEGGKKSKKARKNPALALKLRTLLDTIKDYKDKNGRILSTIFLKLPSRTVITDILNKFSEYPGYYEVIKNPIDLDRICHKLRIYAYDSLEQLLTDFLLMFDNACKFNEPDSQIYKDALILQRLALQTKLSLVDDDGHIPDVKGAVREILTSIFSSVYNHQDEEGRCYTDTMAELPEFDESDGEKIRAISLDLIKSRLDRGFYKRLDTFQNDMFLCFDRARRLSRTDSQLFADSIELHSFFIQTRNEMCASGGVLKSPALNYTQEDLNVSVQALKEEKLSKEVPQEEDVIISENKKDETDDTSSLIQVSQSESYNEQVYSIGDFVYVSPSPGYNSTLNDPSQDGNSNPTKGNVQSNIANIQKLWTEPDGTKMFEGIWFFRPDQTYHLPTRKFLQKEVFRSEVRSTAQLSEITGKCWVMTVKGKEYFTYAPQGYNDDDVYVCEYRYSSRGRSFTKLNSWAFGSESIILIPRKKVLEPIRVASVFRERVERHKEELQFMEDDAEKSPVEEFPNIELSKVSTVAQHGYTFYEQFHLPCGPVKAGDYVYVRVENAKKLVAKIDTMWSDSTGVTYFHGPWFTSLSEISPGSVLPGRTFYKQEIFQSSIEDTNPLLSICGRCCVLEVEEYVRLRPTEILEDDVYLCESMYEEARRQIKKFDGLQKMVHTDPRVHQDEIYFFRRPISLIRVDLDGTVIPEMPKLKAVTKFESVGSPLSGIKIDLENQTEDSSDGSPPSLATSDVASGIGSTTGLPTPSSGTKKTGKTPGKKVVTGYILYSSEVRKSVAEKNPTSSFGEISRIVGNDWRKKTAREKLVFEEKAARLNEEKELAFREGLETPKPEKPPKEPSKQEVDIMVLTMGLKKDPDWIFECCWSGCDWQFEDALDLIEHCIHEPKGHVPTVFKDSNPTDGEFQCAWKNCGRVKKGANPFPNLARLLKHVKDIHIMKGNGRIIHPDMRSKKIVLCHDPKRKLPPKSKISTNGHLPFLGPIAPPLLNAIQASSTPIIASAAAQNPTVQPQPQRPIPQPEPLFIAVPPRPQKLLHSEAYIRYIESLHTSGEGRTQPTWEKSLKATVDNTTPPDIEKLPVQWLGNGAGTHGSTINALWALRDFMMKDALNLKKLLE